MSDNRSFLVISPGSGRDNVSDRTAVETMIDRNPGGFLPINEKENRDGKKWQFAVCVSAAI